MEPFGSPKLALSQLEDDYVLNNVDRIYPLLLKCIIESKEDSEVIHALKIAFGPCTNAFSLEESDERIFQHVCPVAKRIFVTNLQKFESYQEDNESVLSKNCFNCEEIVSMLARAIECCVSKVSKMEIMKVRSLLICSSEVLCEIYGHCSRISQLSVSQLNHLSPNLTLIFRKAQDLQKNLFQLMSKIEISAEECAIDVLNEILTFFYKCGMALMHLDVKTMAELWRGYISTVEKYSEQLKNYHEVSVPVECLSQHLINQLEKFIHEDSAIFQNVEKSVKVLCFILKVIIKIVEKFTGYLKNCQNSLINMLINLNKFSYPQLRIHNKHHSDFEHLKQLVTGVDPLLNCLISDKDFAEKFSSFLENVEISESKRYPLLLLSCLIVRKLTFASLDTRNVWLTSDNNILRWIFQILTKCNFELCLDLKFPCRQTLGKAKQMTDCHGHLLMGISAFLMTSTAREFALAERVLIKYILDVNPWCSLLAADVWCILARFADSELCHEQLNSLVLILNHFGAWSKMPQKYLLESLIKRLFPLLSEKDKASFMKNHPRETNRYLWNILEISNSSENVNIFNSSTNKFLSGRILDERGFEEMECTLNGFRPDKTNLGSEFERNLWNLWKFDSVKLMSNPLSKRYLKFLCSATESAVSSVSSICIHQILREIKSSLGNVGSVVELRYLGIVSRLAREEEPLNDESVCRLISSLFYDFLKNRNAFVRAASIDMFSNFAYSTRRTRIITESIRNDAELKIRLKNYIQRLHPETDSASNLESLFEKLKNSKWEHFCVQNDFTVEFDVSSDSCEPPLKKIVLDKIEGNSQLENSIIALRTEAEKIRRKSGDLSGAQRMEISSIADILREIVGPVAS